MSKVKENSESGECGIVMAMRNSICRHEHHYTLCFTGLKCSEITI